MNDFEFEIILPEDSALIDRLPRRGIKIVPFHMQKDKSFSSKDVGSFLDYFRSNPRSILHTHASLSARLGGRLAGIDRCLSTRHCAFFDDHVSKKPFLQSKVYNYCTDLTISTADHATDNLIKEGIDSKKIITIRNGSKRLPPISQAKRDSILKELNIPSEAIIIGCCARLEKVKGQDLIIRIAADICASFDNVYFLFIGGGTMEHEYKMMACLYGCEEKIRFTGYVSDPWNYQNLFYINVNSSRGTETSCLAISECMSAGIPTVASSFGGNKEMIDDRECGLLFECDNAFDLKRAITELLSDSALYDKLSLGSRRKYDEYYSLEKMCEEYRRMYRAIS